MDRDIYVIVHHVGYQPYVVFVGDKQTALEHAKTIADAYGYVPVSSGYAEPNLKIGEIVTLLVQQHTWNDDSGVRAEIAFAARIAKYKAE